MTPLYLLHRYQIEAAAKAVGGIDYSYAVRGDGSAPVALLPPAMQLDALDALLQSVDPAELTLSQRILDLIPPPSPGRGRGREQLPSRAGPAFDPVAAAEMAADLTFGMVFDGARAARLVDHRARAAGQPGLGAIIDRVLAATWRAEPQAGLAGEVGRAVDFAALRRLMLLAAGGRVGRGASAAVPTNFDWPTVPERNGSFQVRAEARGALSGLGRWLEANPAADDPAEQAHRTYAGWMIERFLEDPGAVELPAPLRAPDGSPIGCGVGRTGASHPAFPHLQ